jgi:hypothetical protein
MRSAKARQTIAASYGRLQVAAAMPRSAEGVEAVPLQVCRMEEIDSR